MPLDKSEGEPVISLGPHYVVPVANYANEPSFNQACWHAVTKFKDAGCRELSSITIPEDAETLGETDWTTHFRVDEVIAQIHPHAKPRPMLVFWFSKRCRGGLEREEMDVERFIPYAYEIAVVQHAAGHA